MNYFEKYFKETLDFDKTDEQIIKTVVYKCRNLRVFILLFNSISNILSLNNELVNLADLAAVQFLKLQNDGILELLKNNPKMFVCSNKDYLGQQFDFRTASEKNKERREFIENYFGVGKEYYQYADLMELLFPNYDGFGSREVTGSDRERAEKGKRIYSGKYFSTYFDEKETGHTIANNDLMHALSIIDGNRFYTTLDKVFETYAFSDHSELLRQIDSMLSSNDIVKDNLLWYLLNRYYWFDDNVGFLKSSTRQICSYIISKLLVECDDVLFNSFMKEYKDASIRELVLLNSIRQFIDHDANGNKNEKLKNRLKEITNLIDKKCNYVFGNSIDIFSEDFYQHGLLFVLFRKDSKKTYSLVKNVVSNNNYCAFLNEFINVSVSEKVNYEIDVSLLKTFYPLENITEFVKHFDYNGQNGDIIRKLFTLAINNGDSEERKGLSFDIDNQPSFHYDFYNLRVEARYYNKPEYIENRNQMFLHQKELALFLQTISKKYRIDTMFVGSDWQGTDKWNKIEEKLAKIGCKVVYLPHTDGIGSTLLREKINE